MRTVRILNDVEAKHAMNLITALNCYPVGHPDHSRIMTALERYGVEVDRPVRQAQHYDDPYDALIASRGLTGC